MVPRKRKARKKTKTKKQEKEKGQPLSSNLEKTELLLMANAPS